MKKLKILFTIFFLSSGFILTAQYSASDIWINAESDDFATIQQKAETYFVGRDLGRGSGYNQWKRWEYLNERRLTPNGKVTNHTLFNWEEYQQYLEAHPQFKDPDPTDVTNGSWVFMGPTSYQNGAGWNPGIGRINCIAFHPTSSSTFYVGAPAGGMWKTTNDGGSWTNLCNGLPSIGVSGIVVHPTNPNKIYILTGDGDGGNTNSIGVLVTNDGGNSWTSTGLTFDKLAGRRGYKLRIHPTNSNILFAATSGGIYKTTDAGVNWTLVASGGYYDIAFKPGSPEVMYATRGSRFYRSSNSGDSWNQIFSGVPTNATRIQIGVTPNNPAYVYLLCGPAFGNFTFVGVYRSYDSGLNFEQKTNYPNIIGPSSNGLDSLHQTTYDLAMVVSRTDYADIMIGGINTWTSSDYGFSWTITSFWSNPLNAIGYTHADIHALEINPLNNHLYCGSDGGIFKTTDFGLNWTDLTAGISNTQFYRIAGYEPTLNLIIGGTQDNGTNKWTGSSYMTHVLGADGMDCMIDYTNPNIMYFCAQNGGLHKSINGGVSSTGIKPNDDAIGSWVTPIIMNPSNPNIIYAGYNDVYKSTNGGSSWSNMGIDGRGAMDIAASNTNRVYASVGSVIYRTDDAGISWSNISGGLPGIGISFIAVNPNNSLDVFVTLVGFNSGEKVYRSTNAGLSWTNITGSLPNIITNCIAYEDTEGNPDDALYIGTDVGVFYRNNNLGDWLPFSNWLPTVPVFDLEINETFNYVYAGTFGRGLWRSPTFTNCDNSWTLGGNAPVGYSYYQANDFITSYRVFDQGIGQEGYYKAGNQITLTPGFRVANGSKFKAFLGPCTAGIPDNSLESDGETQVKVYNE